MFLLCPLVACTWKRCMSRFVFWLYLWCSVFEFYKLYFWIIMCNVSIIPSILQTQNWSYTHFLVLVHLWYFFVCYMHYSVGRRIMVFYWWSAFTFWCIPTGIYLACSFVVELGLKVLHYTWESYDVSAFQSCMMLAFIYHLSH